MIKPKVIKGGKGDKAKGGGKNKNNPKGGKAKGGSNNFAGKGSGNPRVYSFGERWGSPEEGDFTYDGYDWQPDATGGTQGAPTDAAQWPAASASGATQQPMRSLQPRRMCSSLGKAKPKVDESGFTTVPG